jgi:BlaI family penicillinase repressor
MVKKRPATRLTGGEISIVRMLWESGEATLSEAHRAMEDRGESIGYTTVQTRLERLVQKGVVAKSGTRPAKYSAALSPDEVSGPLLDLLVERVSGPVPLVAQLLQDASLTREDLDELKRLVAEAEEGLRKKGSGE